MDLKKIFRKLVTRGRGGGAYPNPDEAYPPKKGPWGPGGPGGPVSGGPQQQA